MKIHRLWVNNPLRNYHYLVECEETKETVVFDPFDVELIMATVKEHNLNVTTIINTHEHDDHVSGNGALKVLTNAKLYAPDFSIFDDADVLLSEGDQIKVGKNLSFFSRFTPGHTNYHFSYLLVNDGTPHLFSGDTIFNAGAGHVYSGKVDDLYRSFEKIKSDFKDETLIYPGHDLFESNLKFALSLEPSNQCIKNTLELISTQTPASRKISSLAEESQYNPFMRINNAEIISNLIENSALKESQTNNSQAVFSAIRKLRNNW